MRLVSTGTGPAEAGSPPKYMTRPFIAIASITSACALGAGAATIATSIPRPPVAARAPAARSSAFARTSMNGAISVLISNRCGARSVMSTRAAPRARARRACMRPIGPAPTMRTVSF